MVDDLNDLNDRIEVFLHGKIKVHIDLYDGTFLNGFITKKVKENVYWMIEDKLGEIFLFAKDIDRIQVNMKREVRE